MPSPTASSGKVLASISRHVSAQPDLSPHMLMLCCAGVRCSATHANVRAAQAVFVSPACAGQHHAVKLPPTHSYPGFFQTFQPWFNLVMTPVPLQMQAIPIMLHHREVLACAPTGIPFKILTILVKTRLASNSSEFITDIN